MKLSSLNIKAMDEYEKIVELYIHGTANKAIAVKVIALNNKYNTSFKIPGY